MMLHTYNPNQYPSKYQLPTPYGFQDIAQTRFYRSRSLQQSQRSNHRKEYYGKVKSRSDHDVAKQHPLTNVPTRYQLPTPYHF